MAGVPWRQYSGAARQRDKFIAKAHSLAMPKTGVEQKLASFGASRPATGGEFKFAPAVAGRLRGDAVFVVDLSAVVSKYIGETEKNLERLFAAAADAGVSLLFDEAEALFGKRTEVRDAHDRYANIDVAYLVQLAEANGGVAVLATNFKGNIDNAFLRRFRVIIDFPPPPPPPPPTADRRTRREQRAPKTDRG